MISQIKKLYKKLVPEKTRNNFIYFKLRLKSIFLRGDNYSCNCCGRSFKKFLSHGNITRENVLCPNCYSLERTRVLQFYLERETDIYTSGKHILHFAPERALEKKLGSVSKHYISADINPALAQHVVDITDIPFPDNTFDYVICSHVLGHVPDEAKAIDEMYRVLKPGGKAIIMAVLSDNEETFEDASIQTPAEKLKHYGEDDLVRLHGRDFPKRLIRENITLNEQDYRLTFSAEEQKRFSLGDGHREMIFECTKNTK